MNRIKFFRLKCILFVFALLCTTTAFAVPEYAEESASEIPIAQLGAYCSDFMYSSEIEFEDFLEITTMWTDGYTGIKIIERRPLGLSGTSERSGCPPGNHPDVTVFIDRQYVAHRGSHPSTSCELIREITWICNNQNCRAQGSEIRRTYISPFCMGHDVN